jgi:trans-aconitate 2-methyltransferase
MSQDAWKPDLYGKFAEERSRPFFDLLALVRPRPGMRVVDLGCGTGALTAEAHRRLAARETLGIDASPAMLEKAGPLAGGGLAFRIGDAGDFGRGTAGAWDLVLSNAALHWVPDHAALLPRLAASLAPGGQLAVQVPANHDHPAHLAAHALAREAPFAAALGGYVRETPVLAPEAYALLLRRAGFAEQHVRLQVYLHELVSPAEVMEWLRGSLLTDYERRLAPDLWREYLEAYRVRLEGLLPGERPYPFTYKRILLWGRR